MKRILLVLIAAGVAGYFVHRHYYKAVARESAHDTVTGVGTVEVTQVDVASKLGGYIVELRYDAGDTVKTGDQIAKIDRPDLDAQLTANQAALAGAQAVLTDLRKGPRTEEVESVRADVAAAKSRFDKAKLELDRYAALQQTGAATKETRDIYQNTYDVAKSSLESAEAKYRLVLEGTRPDQILAQEHTVKVAEATVRLTQTQIADTTIVSPLDGVALTRNLEKGDYANIGASIVTIANLQDAWVRIYVPSPQLGLIRLGQEATIAIDAYPDRRFYGRVKEISQQAEFTPRQTLTKYDRANTVYAVKVGIDNANGTLKPGMPVEVELQ